MKILKKIISSLLLLSLVIACTKMEQEDLFDKSPSERIEKYKSDYTNFLENAENGWVFQYYARNVKKFGAINYYLKFKDGYVTAEKDGNEDTSMYTLLNRRGAVLSFNLDNKVLLEIANKRAENPLDFDVDVDFQFSILSATEDEFVLKGLRSGQICRLIKVNDVDYETNQVGVKGYIEGKGIAGFISNGDVVEVTHTPDKLVSYNLKQRKEQKSFVYTDKGIRLYEPLKIKGVEYSELILDKTENVLKTEEGEVVFRLGLDLKYDFNQTWYVIKGVQGSQFVKNKFVSTVKLLADSYLYEKYKFQFIGQVLLGKSKINYLMKSQWGSASAYKTSAFRGSLNEGELKVVLSAQDNTYYGYFNFVFDGFSEMIESNSLYEIKELDPSPYAGYGVVQYIQLISKNNPNVYFDLLRFKE